MVNQFKNIHSYKRCFIIGNGPSIKKQDLFPLKEEITFCTNWFLNHEFYSDLDVDYYCSYDENFVEPEINKIWVEKLNQKKIIKFFPDSWQKYNLPFKDIHFVRFNNEIIIYEENKFSVDLENTGSFNGETVVINFCIPLSIYMGCNEIYLLGCDSNYGISKNNSLSEAYFYKPKEQFTSNKLNSESEKVWQNKIFKSYEIIKKYADSRNIRIINSTIGGNLEVFPRMGIEKVISC